MKEKETLKQIDKKNQFNKMIECKDIQRKLCHNLFVQITKILPPIEIKILLQNKLNLNFIKDSSSCMFIENLINNKNK